MDYARFEMGTGDDLMRVNAYKSARTDRWEVNWSAFGSVHAAVARAYAELISRAADWCDTKND